MHTEVPDDARPQRHGWAPGGYSCTCNLCGKRFGGDKRARNCAPCAYSLPDQPTSQPRSAWQAIDTAPKDGTLIDVWATERVPDVKWLRGYWRHWALDGYDNMAWVPIDGLTPTHWMPLPAPPIT